MTFDKGVKSVNEEEKSSKNGGITGQTYGKIQFNPT